LFLVIVLLKLT